MANQWFRLYAEFASDHKVQMMSEVDQRRLVMLFCFRCNSDETLHDTEIAFQLRVSIDEWMATKQVFIERGFIDKDNNILNWDKRQYISDTSTDRVRKYRDKLKQECNVSETPPEQIQNRTDTEQIININCPHQDIVDLYHKNLPMLPKVKLWTSKRANTLKLRWSEDKSRQSLEFWDNLFSNIAKSDFLTGKNSQWRADLEWIINPSNLVKILEGKYDNRDLTQPVKHDSLWRNDDASILKKAASLGVYTSGKSRFEIIAAIDKKEGRV